MLDPRAFLINNKTGRVVATTFIEFLSGNSTTPSLCFTDSPDSGLQCENLGAVNYIKNGINLGELATKSTLIGGSDAQIQFNNSGNFDGSADLTWDNTDKLLNVRSARFTGSISIGGTGAANTIDEYEEGTWTPDIEATTGTYATMVVDIVRATYTKIGRLVQVQAFIRTDDVDTTGGSGALKVTGLPFSANSAANARQLGSPLLMEYNNNAAYSGTYAAHQAGGGGDAIVFKEVSAGSVFAAASHLEGSQLQQGTSANRNWMSFSLQYFTD